MEVQADVRSRRGGADGCRSQATVIGLSWIYVAVES